MRECGPGSNRRSAGVFEGMNELAARDCFVRCISQRLDFVTQSGHICNEQKVTCKVLSNRNDRSQAAGGGV